MEMFRVAAGFDLVNVEGVGAEILALRIVAVLPATPGYRSSQTCEGHHSTRPGRPAARRHPEGDEHARGGML